MECFLKELCHVIQLSLYPLFKIIGILTAKECDAG